MHIPTYDANTNCATFTECVTKLRDWSLANPSHGPIFVQIEPKHPSGMTTTVWNTYDESIFYFERK